MSVGQDASAGIVALEEQTVAWRRHLHRHPELSFEEHETSAFVAELLESFGIATQRPTPTSVLGTIRGGAPGPVVALRADIDALPILEENELPFASGVPGRMHACGHDGHAAILLATAKLLAGRLAELPGEVRLIFQHAEERPPGGARELIRAGVMEGVDSVLGLHLWSGLDVGRIAVPAGPCMAAADVFEIEIVGSGGHAALPHTCVDPVVVGAEVVTNLQHLVARTVDPVAAAVLSVTRFHAGSADNVIPGAAVLGGTVRTFDEGVRSALEGRLEQVVRGVTEAHGAGHELTYERGYDAVVNDEGAAARAAAAIREAFGAGALVEMAPIMGGDDFTYYQQEAPGCYFFVGARSEAAQSGFPHHHPRFTIDERALEIGYRALSAAALRALGAPQATR